MDRTSRVLVGYATAGGSTQSIAERIADVLRHAGLTVTCRPVGPDVDPGTFDAVVLGSAVHDSELQKIEQRFPGGRRPRDHRMFAGIVDLRQVPLWGRLFFRAAGGRSGDQRDWPAVDAWATEIADGLDAGGARHQDRSRSDSSTTGRDVMRR